MDSFLGLKPNEKTALFIDGANLYKTTKLLEFDIDYKRLLSLSQDLSKLVRAYYFTSIHEDREQDYSPLRPLVDWLDYNGYTMITKATKDYTDAQGNKRHRGAIEIEMTVEMLTLAPHLDHIIMFTGNGDFCRAIAAVQAMATRVTVVSTIKSSPPMASDDLRRCTDRFIDIVEIENAIGRNYTNGSEPNGDEHKNLRHFDDHYEDNDYRESLLPEYEEVR